MGVVLMLCYILQHDIEYFNEFHDEAALIMIKSSNYDGEK